MNKSNNHIILAHPAPSNNYTSFMSQNTNNLPRHQMLMCNCYGCSNDSEPINGTAARSNPLEYNVYHKQLWLYI